MFFLEPWCDEPVGHTLWTVFLCAVIECCPTLSLRESWAVRPGCTSKVHSLMDCSGMPRGAHIILQLLKGLAGDIGAPQSPPTK